MYKSEGRQTNSVGSDIEEKLIKQFVYYSYQRGSIFFPQGLCGACHMQLFRLREGEEQGVEQDGDIEGEVQKIKNLREKLVLPEDYFCQLPHQTRKMSQEQCDCRWCKLARLNGLSFRRWQQEIRNRKQSKPPILCMCQNCGKGLPDTQVSHTCSSSDLQTVRNMMVSIPEQLKAKLAHSLLTMHC